MEPIKDLDHAREVINNLQRRVDKYHHAMLDARSRVYDYLFKGKEEPLEKELKAQVVYLDSELKKVIEERDKLKEKMRTIKEVSKNVYVDGE